MKIWYKLGTLLLLLLLLPGCSPQPVEAQVYAMDTVMTLKLWGSGAETAAQELSRLFQEQEELLSVTRPDSLVSRLNSGETVELPQSIQPLFQEALSLSRRTGGALDPCLYPVTSSGASPPGHTGSRSRRKFPPPWPTPEQNSSIWTAPGPA